MNQLEVLSREEIVVLITQLHHETRKLKERELQRDEQTEELSTQKEELTAAIEELIPRNHHLK